jgi:Fur family transcriptional regulator, ferric uptake regulator
VAANQDLKVSSVYRNLAILEECGIVHRIDAGEHARYELAEDLSQRHHHHLICASCGAVEDFEPGGTVEQRAVEGLAKAAKRLGWQVTGHRLDVVGVCANCLQTSSLARRGQGR